MSKLNEFIESGLLELYVLGLTSPEENREVELMNSLYEEVSVEIESITRTLIHSSAQIAPEARSTVKPLLVATIDYTERIKHGEPKCDPPILNEGSTLEDYKEWLDRADMVTPESYDEIFIKLIASTSKAISAIVWIKHETPMETHGTEHEKFLIVEGTCDIIIDNVPHSLKRGDYMSIPLYSDHIVKVTSDIPCKVVLQRVAA
jgi:mannose-6-phosphate isomerase-like protein (cupin superfamily)